MEIDQLTVLVNRYRRLKEAEEPNESALEKAYDDIVDYLQNNNRRFIVRASAEVEFNTSEDSDFDWLIDYLVDDRMTLDEAIAEDFKNDCSNYIGWDDIHLSIENEDGKELAHLD